MWIFISNVGFLSVVEHDRGSGQLVVRARDRDDLVRLKQLYLPTLGAIENSPRRDYAVRAHCSKKAFAMAVGAAAERIGYANFKAETAKVLGGEREAVYADVWATLLRLQKPRVRSSR